MRRASTGNATEWQLGLRAFREGRVREAADRLRTAADDVDLTVMQAVRFQTLAYLGAALYALGHPADAVATFEDAILLCPMPKPPPDLHINLANAYLAVGRREDARESLQVALADAPGHVEARMMLERLENAPADAPVAGAVLGESPDVVKNYIRTLSFSRVASNGFDPSQVRQALTQIERYINFLSAQVDERDEMINKLDEQIAQYKKMENNYIDLLQSSRTSDPLATSSSFKFDNGNADITPQPEEEQALTPIERLFQKKV
jgi:tetratricopeptide (TPR) repeat protein